MALPTTKLSKVCSGARTASIHLRLPSAPMARAAEEPLLRDFRKPAKADGRHPIMPSTTRLRTIGRIARKPEEDGSWKCVWTQFAMKPEGAVSRKFPAALIETGQHKRFEPAIECARADCFAKRRPDRRPCRFKRKIVPDCFLPRSMSHADCLRHSSTAPANANVLAGRARRHDYPPARHDNRAPSSLIRATLQRDSLPERRGIYRD